MTWPFKRKPEQTKKGKWIQPDSQWAVGDKCCLVEDLSIAGNAPPKDMVLTVSDVFEGKIYPTTDRTVGLKFSNWPMPVNSDYHGWNALAFRKVKDVKRAEETEIGVTILQAKPAPDIKRTKPAKVSHD